MGFDADGGGRCSRFLAHAYGAACGRMPYAQNRNFRLGRVHAPIPVVGNSHDHDTLLEACKIVRRPDHSLKSCEKFLDLQPKADNDIITWIDACTAQDERVFGT